MTRKISEIGLDHIKRWEGKRLKAYKDVADVWTIGYGHTAKVGPPRPRHGMQITTDQAMAILMADLTQYERAVASCVQVTLNDNQFAALVSFSYNVGVGALKKSTLLKKLNRGDYEAVPTELMKWTYARGKRRAGLVNRRAAESGLWVKGEFVASNYEQPKVETTSILKAPEALAPFVGLLSGLWGFLSATGPIQWALAIVMLGAFTFGICFFVWRHKVERS